MLAILATALAMAGNSPNHWASVTLGVAPTVGFGSTSYGGTGVARIQLNVPHVSIDVGLREGAVSHDTRILSNVHAGVRWWASPKFSIRGAFSHNHEVLWTNFRRQPIQATLGMQEDIAHRTGFEVSVGFLQPLAPDEPELDRYAFHAEVVGMIFPDPRGSSVYAALELGFTFHIGPQKSP